MMPGRARPKARASALVGDGKMVQGASTARVACFFMIPWAPGDAGIVGSSSHLKPQCPYLGQGGVAATSSCCFKLLYSECYRALVSYYYSRWWEGCWGRKASEEASEKGGWKDQGCGAQS